MWYFTKYRYTVSIPLFVDSHYDLIISKNNITQKVQVKSSRRKDNNLSYAVALTTSGGNKSGNSEVKRIDKYEVDYVFIYIPETNDCYLFPAKELHNKKQVNVNPNISQYIGKVGII